jgi:hypothetical protein
LGQPARRQDCRAAFAIYYNDEYTERNIDIEAALPAVAGALERAGVSPDQVRARGETMERAAQR